jgi:hypothetical protein
MRDLGTVECVKELEHPPWINNNADNMITQLMAYTKGSGPARIRAELETIIEEEGLREYVRIHTDASVMAERAGCEQGGENQIGWTDVNFQCGGAGHHRSNKDHKKMGSGQTHNND